MLFRTALSICKVKSCLFLLLPFLLAFLTITTSAKGRRHFQEFADPNGIDRETVHTQPNDVLYQGGLQWALNNTGQIPPGGKVDADIDAPEAYFRISILILSSK